MRRSTCLVRAAMSFRMFLPQQYLILDVLVAVPRVLGLTSTLIIQASTLPWPESGIQPATPARVGFSGSGSYLSAHRNRGIKVEAAASYHRHPLGLRLHRLCHPLEHFS